MPRRGVETCLRYCAGLQGSRDGGSPVSDSSSAQLSWRRRTRDRFAPSAQACPPCRDGASCLQQPGVAAHAGSITRRALAVRPPPKKCAFFAQRSGAGERLEMLSPSATRVGASSRSTASRAQARARLGRARGSAGGSVIASTTRHGSRSFISPLNSPSASPDGSTLAGSCRGRLVILLSVGRTAVRNCVVSVWRPSGGSSRRLSCSR